MFGEKTISNTIQIPIHFLVLLKVKVWLHFLQFNPALLAETLNTSITGMVVAQFSQVLSPVKGIDVFVNDV